MGNKKSGDVKKSENMITKMVGELKKGDKNLIIEVILLEKVKTIPLKTVNSTIYQFKVADDSGSILCNLYDDVGEKLKESDIIKLEGAYASIFKKHLVLYSPRVGYGQIIKTGEFFKSFCEYPNLSEPEYEEDDTKEEKSNH